MDTAIGCSLCGSACSQGHSQSASSKPSFIGRPCLAPWWTRTALETENNMAKSAHGR
ncbi:hypothetical protein X949_5109 [Burkholderia pseudomallei MSHR5609]|nr:hypothetical protein X949_5109 [Burkholderia pseudomallei MSHR5609]